MSQRYNETLLNLIAEVEAQISINEELINEMKERVNTVQKANKEKKAKIKQLIALMEE